MCFASFLTPLEHLGLELRVVSTHPRLLLYLGLAQRHIWAVASHSSHPEQGTSLLSALVNRNDVTDPHRNAGV